ncbi:CAAX prenyl protease 2 [Silene latifolia]|uniref:CAAX prenyl protease 2 n=1 Tax=Silene latifolia TaxID=37657 RepID=UPI003D788F18
MMETLTVKEALTACGGMTVVYVAVLYSPTLIFRRPPPTSFYQFMIRRFICAFVATLLCLFLSSLLLLPTGSWKFTHILAAYGVRSNHFWHAVVCAFSLTCLMYAGSFVLKLLDLWNEGESPYFSLESIKSFASNIAAWRNLVVAPITEELVFRACMIPLLLCGGFKPETTVFLCPLFFSLAHLNHLLEFYSRKNCSVLKTSMAVGTQLAYTMVFGSYASFLFIRTGHLAAPLVAHIVCNFMGLPVIYSKRGLVVSVASIAGAIAFFCLLTPLTVPALYNIKIDDDCSCWQGYCN